MTTGSGSATRGEEPSALRRLVFLGLAVVAGVALALVAPDDWEPGAGTTTVTYRGEVVLSAPIEVGATESVSYTGAASGVEIELTYPRGFL